VVRGLVEGSMLNAGGLKQSPAYDEDSCQGIERYSKPTKNGDSQITNCRRYGCPRYGSCPLWFVSPRTTLNL